MDGGGALNLDDVSADVRICAQATEDGTVLRIGLGGDEATAHKLAQLHPLTVSMQPSSFLRSSRNTDEPREHARFLPPEAMPHFDPRLLLS